MDLLVTYGALALFFGLVVLILQRSYVADRDFSDFTVAGRSFGGFFQAMAFFNTYQPGTVFFGVFGFILGNGLVGVNLATLLAPLVMYLMAERVWTWGARHDLKTQPELMALRFRSRGLRVAAALVGVLGLFPWMVLGMQSFGAVFHALSLGALGFTASVVLGVAVMSVRQIWTIRMGMRGIVISDVFQGIVAYIVGSALMIGLIVWLVRGGASLEAIDPQKFVLPGPGSDKPLLFFSLTLLPLLCSLCWPDLFIRLYTGSGVAAVKRSSAYCAPLSLVFVGALSLLALLCSTRPELAASPETAWFLVNQMAGGVPLLALAGVIVFAASMGNIDATVQSMGAQIANDVVGAFRPQSRPLGERGLMLVSQVSIAAITLISALIACLPLPSLFSIGLFAFQVMVQLAVPLYLGIFTRIGTAGGALAGMLVGIAVVAVLQVLHPLGIPWALGLTSGFVGLIANLAIYLGAAVLAPPDPAERARLDALFAQGHEGGAGSPLPVPAE